ncbi:MAG: hypothetical protein M3367_05805 [Acidobacteriota bacterium]|nr:hypothetical protein [Acidobacteriota bacterium]
MNNVMNRTVGCDKFVRYFTGFAVSVITRQRDFFDNKFGEVSAIEKETLVVRRGRKGS